MDSASISLEYAILDVFTKQRYAGNPLAIVQIPASVKLTQDQKQKIAREFNLSETTFVHEPEASEPSVWTVDIFTATAELPFAGHPTIGTACFVLSDAAQKAGAKGVIQAGFNLKAGRVQLQYDAENNSARAAIPHDVHVHKRTFSSEELLALQPALKGFLGGEQVFPVVSIVKGMAFVLIELESLEALGRVTTTSHSLSLDRLDEGWDKTFVGTYFYVKIPGGVGGVQQLRTRMIEGTLEDPATGSAASDLVAYLSLTDGSPGQTLEYDITQGVEMGRKSDIHLQVVMGVESGIETIVLGGSAVPVMEGRLSV